jgi:hypothetical protein
MSDGRDLSRAAAVLVAIVQRIAQRDSEGDDDEPDSGLRTGVD